MQLKLEQLRAFLMVVRNGGVVKAAQAMNLTQPAVTARIRNLEDALGAQLFDRAAGGARLTKRGEMLLQYALRLEQLSNQIERDIVDPAGAENHLRIGASETVAQSWLPDFIAELHSRFPKLQIEFNVDVSVNLRDGLVAREIDLAFLLGPISEHSVENILLPSFELAWYTAASDPMTPEAAATLFGKPVITYARNTRPYRETRDAVYERLGPGVRLFPSSSLSAALRLVERGLGVSPLPVSLAAPWEREGRLVRFDPGWLPTPLQFTASYVADPPSHVTETAAKIAAEVARVHRDA
ncbi:MAG: LysR family transcriptional regulator [Rhodobacteraceae bacterium]|nr:LysR family transcriptional regulator [Paracoccaceae bacterium]